MGKIRAIFSMMLTRIYLMINKYDISICYSHHHPILAKYAKAASNNSIVFIHSNLYNGTTKKQQKKYKKCHYENFKKIVCVSNDSKLSVMKMINRNDILVLNNIVDGDRVINNSLEQVQDFTFEDDKIYFINVGRHDEQVKRLVRILNATERLNKEFKNFEIIFIGDGPDDSLYEKIIKDKGLKNVHLLGRKSNPYNYMKKCNALLTSSIREGNPVVFVEAKILDLPIITTDVSDAKFDVDKKYGIVVKNDDDSIYEGMKKFLQKPFIIKEKFNYVIFNENLKRQIDKLLYEVIE